MAKLRECPLSDAGELWFRKQEALRKRNPPPKQL